MARRKVSIVLVPEQGSIHRFEIGVNLLSGLIVFAFLCLTGSIFYVLNWAQTRQLHKVNDGLYSKISKQSLRINYLGRQVEEMKDTTGKILLLAGQDPKSLEPKNNALVLYGQGGLDMDFGSTTINWDDTVWHPVERALLADYNTVGLLAERVENGRKILGKVLVKLESQKDRLDHTPSIVPVRGARWFTSPFGWRISPFTGRRAMHQGLDIAARLGTKVVAPADGKVIFCGWSRGYGNTVIIDHGYGFKTRYGHLNKYVVRRGQRVKRWDIIARVGRTGRATGPHLHYEVIVSGVRVNPESYLLDKNTPYGS